MADAAYTYILDRVVTLEFPPGSRLNEEHLMRATGVGRSPVRDALRRLAQEQLVVIYPRQGSFVAEIRLRDERWLAELRLPLEGVAARLAADRATPEERLRLKALADTELDDLIPQELLALDATIHRLIYQATHNPYLEATLNIHFNLGLRIWHYNYQFIPDLLAHVEGELRVAALIADQSAEEAGLAAENHLIPTVHESRWLSAAEKSRG